MNRARIGLVMLLLAVGAGLSVLLLLAHHGVEAGGAAVQGLCGIGEDSGCARVADSVYSSVGGVSLAAIGVFLYASLLILLGFGLRAAEALAGAVAALAAALLGLAVAVDMMLLGVQALAIGAYCSLCLCTYAVNAAACYALLPVAAPLGSVAALPDDTAGRRLLLSWAAASALVLLALVLVEARLDAAAAGLA